MLNEERSHGRTVDWYKSLSLGGADTWIDRVVADVPGAERGSH
jgi:hypothetical protein